MQQHPSTGPGTLPQIAHFAEGCAEDGNGAAVHVPGRNAGPGFWGRVDRGNVGGVRNPAERSAAEFPTLDFRGT
jgi:hypothetical protein